MNSFEQQYYEASAFWANGAVADPANLARIDATVGLIPPGVQSLVDVGCGNGVFLNELLRRGGIDRLLGVDRSEEALKYVRTVSMSGDICSINLPDRSFDCVACLQVLEHLPVGIYERACGELARVAAKHIIVSVPHQERLEQNVTTCPGCRTVFNVDLHLRSYDDVSIASLFSRFGFTLVSAIDPYPRRKYCGSELLRKFVRLFRTPRRDNTFRSPICPVCGLQNLQYALPQTRNVRTATLPQRVRTVLTRIGPEVVERGYWVVACYERDLQRR